MTITNISDVERELRAEITRLKEWAKLGLSALEYASTGNRRAELIAPAIAAFRQALAEQPAIKQDLTPEQTAQQEPVAEVRQDMTKACPFCAADSYHLCGHFTSPPAQQEPVASLAEAIRSEPTEMIHKWRVLELVKERTQQPAQQTCNCQWDGDIQVQQCTLHEAHVDAIHEWAERAKSAEHKFKNFHRLLCERFGYSHDERDWQRDQLSLIEWIAKQVEQPAQQQKPVAIVASHPERIDWLRDEPPDGTLLYTTPPQRKPLTDEQIDAAVKAWFENDIVAGRQPFAKRMRAAIEAAHGIKGDA